MLFLLKAEKNCKEDCEIGILLNAEEGIGILEETLALLPEWMDFIRDEIITVKSTLGYFSEFFTSSIGNILIIEKEKLESLKELIAFAREDIETALDHLIRYTEEELRKNGKVEGDKMKVATKIQKRLLDVRQKIKMIEVDIKQIGDEMEKVERQVNTIVLNAGFESLNEMMDRKDALEALILQANDNKEMIYERCMNPIKEKVEKEGAKNPNKSDDDPFLSGYIYDEKGDLIGGFDLFFITSFKRVCWRGFLTGKEWCISIPLPTTSVEVDNYGAFFKASLPSNVPFAIMVADNSYYGPNRILKSIQSGVIFTNLKAVEGPVYRFYLPYGTTPDYDRDGLSDMAERRIARRYIPAYYFYEGAESWYPTDPKEFFVKRSKGLVYYKLKEKKVLPPTEQNFYFLGYSPYNNSKNFIDSYTTFSGIISKTPLRLEGLPLFHVQPFPAERNTATAIGNEVNEVKRNYKIQYYLFHDYSKSDVNISVLIFINFTVTATHYGDWEHSCLFVETSLLGSNITKVSYHYHGKYAIKYPSQFHPYSTDFLKTEIYVAAYSHAQYWEPGAYTFCGTEFPYLGYGCSTDGTMRSERGLWLPSISKINIEDYSIDKYANSIYNCRNTYTSLPGGGGLEI